MFEKYASEIKKLNSFDKKDILNEKFLLDRKGNLAIYYAPHNEIINDSAKIFVVGITPGWTQTRIAYQIAHKGLINHMKYDDIKRECKRNSRFAGSMRKNLIEMLDELNLNKKLQLFSCSQLFDIREDLLHTTSIIPYPVLINDKNYTGHNPKILEDETLNFYAKKYFCKEIQKMRSAFIVPLGKTVEEVLLVLNEEGLIKKEQCLLGFPHPSGANGHRRKQFEQNKEQLSNKINEYFKKEIDVMDK